MAGLGFEEAEDVDLLPSTQAIDEESLGIKAHNRSSRIHVRPGLKYYFENSCGKLMMKIRSVRIYFHKYFKFQIATTTP